MSPVRHHDSGLSALTNADTAQVRAGTRGVDESDVDGVEVVHARGEGDDTIVAIAEAHRGAVVVTADRRLADRVRAADAEVVGARWLLDQLVD